MTWHHLPPIGCVVTCPMTYALGHTFSQPEPWIRCGVGEACSSRALEARLRFPARPKCINFFFFLSHQFTLFTGTSLTNLSSIGAFFYVFLKTVCAVGHFWYHLSVMATDFCIMEHIMLLHLESHIWISGLQ